MPVPSTSPTSSLQHRTKGSDSGDSQTDEVVFQVGVDNVMRVTARKSVLSAHNEVFHAMFYGPYSQAHVKSRQVAVSDGSRKNCPSVDYINEPDLDGRAFMNLINYLNGEEIELRSVITAVETLHAAQKYLCDGLLNVCVDYITSQLNVEYVLQILQRIRIYVKASNPDALTLRIDPHEPSAPSLHVLDQSSDCCARLCAQLLNNCLEFIDKNASAVLCTEDFEELDAEAVECIITRDELVVKNEGEVLAALVRWATFGCQRRQIPVTTENQRHVMDRLIWHVRFLTMSPKELRSTPFLNQLFTPDELSLLLSHANGQASADRLPLPIRRQLPFIAKPRSYTLVDKEQKAQPEVHQEGSYDREFFTEKFFNCLLCIFE